MSAFKPARLITCLVPLERIVEAEGFNPRTNYGQEDGSFAELVASIREHGVLQAPLVRETQEGGHYTIIGGHRRVRAAREVGLEALTVSVLPWIEDSLIADLPLALIENLHRKSLDPIERAQGLKRLVDAGLSIDEVAAAVGLGRSYVVEQLQLLLLPESVQKSVTAKDLTVTSARMIAGGVRQGLSATRATSIAKKAASENLTAYDTRALVSEAVGRSQGPELRTPSELILAVPYSKKPLVDWALRRYGSLAGALEALQEMSGTAPKVEESSDRLVTGSHRDPMAVVREARSRRWQEVLVGYQVTTGALRATPTGPLAPGFVLICTIYATGAVHVPMTASGPGRSLGERIKDSIEGPKRAGLK